MYSKIFILISLYGLISSYFTTIELAMAGQVNNNGGLFNGVAMIVPSKSGNISQQRSSMIEYNFTIVLKATIKLFRDYMRHLGMVIIAALVTVLACSLKGIVQLQINEYCKFLSKIIQNQC